MFAAWRERVFGAALIGVATSAGALAVLDWAFPPDFARYEARARIVTDRAGQPLRAFMSPDQKWRFATAPGDIDPLYPRMLVAYEDKRFWRHFGVDPIAVGRAVFQALTTGRISSGASTLTMQAARLLEPRPRGLIAKLFETWRAIQLEARLEKAEILSIYLTLAPFGGAVEGVAAASLKLFGRPPMLLTPAEAALLVALPQSPAARRPDRHPAAALGARQRVLARVEAAGVISAAARSAANIATLPARYLDLPFNAPHLAEEIVRVAGNIGHIRTTLDRDLQAALERRLARVQADFPAPTTAAALIVDAATAEVRAIAGGPDYFDHDRAGMLDLTTVERSPGSALKPFVYGLAFDRLIARPDTLIVDRPFREGAYAPRNFDSGYAGDVTISEALIRSLNIPAVKALRRVGPARFDAALATAGVELKFDRENGDPSLALALGGVGLSLRDLARLYVALHGGRAPDALAFRAQQKVAWRRLLSSGAAADLRAILAMAPPPPGHGEALGGEAGTRPRIAYKTGTSYGFRDAVAVGLVRGHVIAVWVGRPDSAHCSGCIGRTAAGPILFDLARLTPEGAAPIAAPPPARTPARLMRFARPKALGLARRPRGRRAVEIGFPADGVRLSLGGSGQAPLVATGGVGPYRWLVDGAPLGVSRPGARLRWRPDGPGFHEIVALDHDGAAARVRVFVEAR